MLMSVLKEVEKMGAGKGVDEELGPELGALHKSQMEYL